MNGTVGKETVYKRGLKQEDPLSPLLFVLVANDLDKMLKNAIH